jgi:hypothetical protein
MHGGGHLELLLCGMEKQAETQEGRNFWVAAFSKTLLSYLFSVVVGHGATHHRHGRDDGIRRAFWSN